MSNESFMGFGTPEALEDAITAGDGPEFMVYSEGLLYAWVCSPLHHSEVESRMASRPCGTRHGWTLSDHSELASGESNPCPCEDDPETRKHYLFTA